MNNTELNSDIFQKVSPKNRVALIYHLQIKDKEAFGNWSTNSLELLNSMGGHRLFNISVDPVPREDMLIDEIIIDEYPSTEIALKYVAETQS